MNNQGGIFKHLTNKQLTDIARITVKIKRLQVDLQKQTRAINTTLNKELKRHQRLCQQGSCCERQCNVIPNGLDDLERVQNKLQEIRSLLFYLAYD